MHYIEEKINNFLSNCALPPDLLERLSEEAVAKLREQFIERFTAKPVEPFRLRMSNIGLPLRTLCLLKKYGSKYKEADIKFKLSGFYGTMLESLLFFLLEASKCNINAKNKKVGLNVEGTTLLGELDIIIDGVVYDVKSASNYSYTNKFKCFESLASEDSFGYVSQGFGYALAEKLPFGGWLVINKEKGIFKVCEVPLDKVVQIKYKKSVLQDIKTKIHHLNNDLPIPPCTGVVKEFFNKKETGNLILDKNCQYCNFKDICYPEAKCLPDVNSKAIVKTTKYYIGKIIRP